VFHRLLRRRKRAGLAGALRFPDELQPDSLRSADFSCIRETFNIAALRIQVHTILHSGESIQPCVSRRASASTHAQWELLP